MRLIDADALKGKLTGSRFHFIRNFINKQPTIDAVYVVRCKDCEYYENEECVNPYIWMSDGARLWPDEDFYCAKGERRSDP